MQQDGMHCSRLATRKVPRQQLGLQSAEVDAAAATDVNNVDSHVGPCQSCPGQVEVNGYCVPSLALFTAPPGWAQV